MILQALYALYHRLEKEPEYGVAPFGFSDQQVTFCVVLKPDGSLHAVEDVRLNEDQRLRPRLVRVPGETKKPGSGFNPGFLWDNSGYMLGYKPKDDDPVRTKKSFAAFRDRHLAIKQAVNHPSFNAVCVFLETWNPEKAVEFPVLDSVNPGYGVFQIVGETHYIHDIPEIQSWWLSHLSSTPSEHSGQCLITGIKGPIVETQPKIKRIGDQSEAVLVSFNEAAFESYQLTQSLNAPISEDAAFKYATALNSLLVGRMSHRHRFQLGDATTVFWTDTPGKAEDFLAAFFQQGGVEEKGEGQDAAILEKLKIFLNALRKGREAYGDIADDPDHTGFYILGLTGQAKGRIGVRFFYQDSLTNLLDNLRKHYRDMELARWTGYGKESRWPAPEFPELWRMLDETCPRRNGEADRDQIPPTLEGPLLRAAMTKQRYPEGLFEAVMRRIHADRVPNYVRCCIIKGYLTRNLGKEMDMSLNTERKDPAYLAGRLFAVLEKTQYDALGELGASIRDRYFGAASATPRVVFPRLLRLYQHHLPKTKTPGRYDSIVREIHDALNDIFPAHLNLADQGLFALGYYHQMKDLWTAKEGKNNQQEDAQ